MLNRFYRHHSLLGKMVFSIFFFALLVTLLISAGRYFFARNNALQTIHGEIDKLAENQLDTLSNSVWELNHTAIDIQLNSILNTSHIIYTALRHGDGKIYPFGSKSDSQTTIIKTFDLVHERNNEKIPLGQVVFHADTSTINTEILHEITAALCYEILGLSITCLFILIIFYRLFGRHINQIVKITKKLDLDTLDEQISLSRNSNATVEND